MLTQSKPAETWQKLLELRCQREIIERWLASGVLADDMQRSLQSMLGEVEDQLRLLAATANTVVAGMGRR
jgi:hypothetical protein